jgi:hypothetical protein
LPQRGKGQNNLGGACHSVATAKTASAVLATTWQRAKQFPRRLPQRGKGQNNFRGACHSVANVKKNDLSQKIETDTSR